MRGIRKLARVIAPRRSDGQLSQALVEFAMVAPIFLLVVFSAVDISRLLYAYTAISSAARDGARTPSLTGSLFTDCQIIQEVELVGQGFPVQMGSLAAVAVLATLSILLWAQQGPM